MPFKWRNDHRLTFWKKNISRVDRQMDETANYLRFSLSSRVVNRDSMHFLRKINIINIDSNKHT